MRNLIKTLAASAAFFAVAATPAMAQDEEEPRTTYEVVMINLADDSQDRWAEIMEEYVIPAHVAAGQTPPVVHWVMMNPDYDLIVINHRPAGMAAFDTHANPGREAFFAELSTLVGGPEALAELSEEYGNLIESTTSIWTHTHP